MSRFVLVTRTADSLGELRTVLARHGIDVLPFPVLREVPADDPTGWESLAAVLDSVRFVAVTSARAADPLRREAEARGLWPRIRRIPAVAVGRASARAAETIGLTVAITGVDGSAALAAELVTHLRRGDKVLHPCGRDRRDELAAGLGQAGVEVVPVVSYAMELTPPDELPVLPANAPVAVLLSSPRAARAYQAVCGGCFRGVPHLAMGASTAATARELGLEVVTLASPTPDSIMEELCQICS